MIYSIILVASFAWWGETHYANQEPKDLPLDDSCIAVEGIIDCKEDSNGTNPNK